MKRNALFGGVDKCSDGHVPNLSSAASDATDPHGLFKHDASHCLLFFFRQLACFSLGALTCGCLYWEISLRCGSSAGLIQDVACFAASLLTALCMLFDARKCNSWKWPASIQRAFAARQAPTEPVPLWRFVASAVGLLVVAFLAIAYAPILLYAICPNMVSRNGYVPFLVMHIVWTSFFLMVMTGVCKRRSSRSGSPMPVGLVMLGLAARLAFVFCICELAKIPMLVALTDKSLSIGSSFLVVPIWAVMQIATVAALVLAARRR